MVLFITLHKVILTVKFVGKSRVLAWVTIQMKAAGQFLYVELFIMLSINYYCVIIQMQAAKSFFFFRWNCSSCCEQSGSNSKVQACLYSNES